MAYVLILAIATGCWNCALTSVVLPMPDKATCEIARDFALPQSNVDSAECKEAGDPGVPKQ